MSDNNALHGLSCPQCAGIVPIPEGQAIVECPYCGLRSYVRGERGLRRYQVLLKVDRKRAIRALKNFLTSSFAIARDLPRRARLQEDFVVYLPFWVEWARVLAWVFGQEKVGSGKERHYVPREIKIAQEMVWNAAACDVGEFGVDSLPLTNQTLEPFDSDLLHDLGMVFEPVGSESEAWQAAEQDFIARTRKLAGLDRVSQSFVRLVRPRMGLVYYPLYVLRYLYRGRSFQVVVDGFSGKVLYGKAPGNTLYRAAVLILGMALGAFLAVDVCGLLAWIAFASYEDNNTLGLLMLGLGAAGAGIGVMTAAYRRFRYGEVYEYLGYKKQKVKRKRVREGGVLRAQEVQT